MKQFFSKDLRPGEVLPVATGRDLREEIEASFRRWRSEPTEERAQEWMGLAVKPLHAVAFRISRNRQDAEDATQEGLTKAFLAAGKFRGESAVLTWLCGIVVRCALNLVKKESKRAPLVDADAIADRRSQASSSSGGGDDDPRLAAVAEAVRALPMPYRMALELVASGEISREEAAAAAGVPLATFQWRYHQAKHRVLESLKRRGVVLLGFDLERLMSLRMALEPSESFVKRVLSIPGSPRTALRRSVVAALGGVIATAVLLFALTGSSSPIGSAANGGRDARPDRVSDAIARANDAPPRRISEPPAPDDEPRAVLKGRVVLARPDLAGDEPIRVWLEGSRGASPETTAAPSGDFALAVPMSRAFGMLRAAKGRFEAPFEIQISADSRFAALTVSPGDVWIGEARLQGAGCVQGRVVDATDGPAENADVLVFDPASPSTTLRAVRTDARGEFLATGIEPGRRVAIALRGAVESARAALDVSAGAVTACEPLRLPAFADVVLRPVDADGRAFPFAALHVPARKSFAPKLAAAVADELGAAAIAVPRDARRLALRLEHPDAGAPVPVELEEQDGAWQPVSAVPRAPRATIRAVDAATREPLRGFTVRTWFGGLPDIVASAGESGSIEIPIRTEPAAPGVPCVVALPGYAAWFGDLDPAAPSPEVELSRGVTVTGRVIDANGAGVAGAWVSWLIRRRAGDSGATDASGRFALRHVAPAFSRLTFRKNGFRSHTVQLEELESRGDVNVPDLVLLPGVTLEVEVDGRETGGPMAMTLSPIRGEGQPGSVSSPRLTARAGGTAAFRDLEPGRYDLLLVEAGSAPLATGVALATVDLKDGSGTTRIAVSRALLGSLRGVVAGGPFSSEPWTAIAWAVDGSHAPFLCELDVECRFHFPQLLAGSYFVAALPARLARSLIVSSTWRVYSEALRKLPDSASFMTEIPVRGGEEASVQLTVSAERRESSFPPQAERRR